MSGSSMAEGENLQKLISKKIITLCAILLLSVTAFAAPVWAQQAEASDAITSARSVILDCYTAVKAAESAGANITPLVGALNEAGSLLSQAEYAYSTSDFDTALNLATQSQNSLADFIEDANTLQETATQQQNIDFLINVVGSILGAFAVIAAGMAAWFYLKRKYAENEAQNQ
jgi:hypothetical protein